MHHFFYLLKYLTFQMIIECTIHVQLEGKGNNFCMLFDSDIQDNNMNMIKCSPLMLFDMPACHAWAHKQRIFDTHTNITTYVKLTKGEFSFWCSGATKYHLVAVQEHFIAFATSVTFGQQRINLGVVGLMPV